MNATHLRMSLRQQLRRATRTDALNASGGLADKCNGNAEAGRTRNWYVIGMMRFVYDSWRRFPYLRGTPETQQEWHALQRGIRHARRDASEARLEYHVYAVVRRLDAIVRDWTNNLKRVSVSYGGTAANERRDCAVRAFAAATNGNYEDAHAVMELVAHRKPGQGTFVYSTFPTAPGAAVAINGYTVRNLGQYDHCKASHQTTVGTFHRNHPRGRYFVVIRQHAFAIVDGTIYDNCQTRKLSRIERVYHVTPGVASDALVLI